MAAMKPVPVHEARIPLREPLLRGERRLRIALVGLYTKAMVVERERSFIGSMLPTSHWPRILTMRTAAFTLATAAAGCASFNPQTGPGLEPDGRYLTLTTPIIAVGDTQEHMATGYPLHDNDSAVDAFVEVTQRPPEQPLFGRRIVQWVLQQHPDEPFIHLGDVLDLSCRTEARRVREIFAATENAGAILPGNHDGLMFGIYGYNVVGAALDENAVNRAAKRSIFRNFSSYSASAMA